MSMMMENEAITGIRDALFIVDQPHLPALTSPKEESLKRHGSIIRPRTDKQNGTKQDVMLKRPLNWVANQKILFISVKS